MAISANIPQALLFTVVSVDAISIASNAVSWATGLPVPIAFAAIASAIFMVGVVGMTFERRRLRRTYE